MLKKYLIIVLLGCMLFAQNVKMDLNARQGASNFHTVGVKKFASLVKKYTNETVDITVYPNSSLIKGNPLKAVKNGTIAMADMFIPFTTGGGKVFGISALPFIAQSYDNAYKLYQIAKPAYEKMAKKWNQKLLYSVTWPPSGFYGNKKLGSLNNLRDFKTRTYDKNSANFVNNAGGSAIALPWGEVYSALRTSLVNSVITSSTSGEDGKFWEVLTDFTKISYAYPLQAVTINLDYWNSLSSSQKDAMLKAATEVEKMQWQVVKKQDKNALDTLAKHGMHIWEANEKLKKELFKVSNEMLNEYLKGANKDIKKIFKEYRK